MTNTWAVWQTMEMCVFWSWATWKLNKEPHGKSLAPNRCTACRCPCFPMDSRSAGRLCAADIEQMCWLHSQTKWHTWKTKWHIKNCLITVFNINIQFNQPQIQRPVELKHPSPMYACRPYIQSWCPILEAKSLNLSIYVKRYLRILLKFN